MRITTLEKVWATTFANKSDLPMPSAYGATAKAMGIADEGVNDGGKAFLLRPRGIYAALPFHVNDPRLVRVIPFYTPLGAQRPRWAMGPLGDVGPHNMRDRFWGLEGYEPARRPLVEQQFRDKMKAQNGLVPTNAAGVDLSPGFWAELGVDFNRVYEHGYSAMLDALAIVEVDRESEFQALVMNLVRA